MLVEISNAAAQRSLCILFRGRVGNRPYAEFVVFQSGLKIGDARVEQVLPGLVENANMASPGHVTHDANSGSPHDRTGRVLRGFSLVASGARKFSTAALASVGAGHDALPKSRPARDGENSPRRAMILLSLEPVSYPSHSIWLGTRKEYYPSPGRRHPRKPTSFG